MAESLGNQVARLKAEVDEERRKRYDAEARFDIMRESMQLMNKAERLTCEAMSLRSQAMIILLDASATSPAEAVAVRNRKAMG